MSTAEGKGTEQKSTGREEFGKFLAELRKEKGYTQKELAENLFVSNKTISKWETGNGMPDVSMLLPLSKLLGVTVTELLECRRLEMDAPVPPQNVERLLQKAIYMSEETPQELLARRKRRGILYAAWTLLSILEILAMQALGVRLASDIKTSLGVYEFLFVLFGAWFWIFIKERLPAYYDENKISHYTDGIFKLHLAGVRLNNKNWPHIVKAGRVWTAAAALLMPVLCLVWQYALTPVGLEYEGKYGILTLVLGSLFVSVLAAAKRNQ